MLDASFDLLIQNGDFVIDESTRQHQQLLILTEKGENREFPTRGVGISNWLNDDTPSGDLNAAIKKEFIADGMKIIAITNVGYTINTEAVYE